MFNPNKITDAFLLQKIFLNNHIPLFHKPAADSAPQASMWLAVFFV